jgi:hypothetical protein
LITREEAARLRDELLDVLVEDARNAERLTVRLDSITDAVSGRMPRCS